jgi:hypothetical protein
MWIQKSFVSYHILPTGHKNHTLYESAGERYIRVIEYVEVQEEGGKNEGRPGRGRRVRIKIIIKKEEDWRVRIGGHRKEWGIRKEYEKEGGGE